jgi:hypothetical protein
MLLTLVTMDSWKTQMMSIQKQDKAQTRRQMFFKARTLPEAEHLPQLYTLVQPISDLDRGGRNVTTDNFFTSVDFENQLKNNKIDTCWDNEAKQKRNSTTVQACQAT